MGCCQSELWVPRNAADRGLDEWEVEDTDVSGVDDVFSSAYAPVISLITINNNLSDSCSAVQEAAAAIFGAYKLQLQSSGHTVSAAVLDKDGKEIIGPALQQLVAANKDFGVAYNVLSHTVETLNGKFAQHAPTTLEINKGCSVKAFDRKARTHCAPQVGNVNKAAFGASQELIKVSFKDGFNLATAIKAILENVKKELGTKVKPKLHCDPQEIAQGKFDSLKLEMLDGGVDPVDVLNEPSKTAYKKLNELIENLQSAAQEIQGLQSKVEEVPGTIAGFDATGAVSEALSGDLFKLPTLLGKVKSNASLAPGAPAVVPHTLGTCRAIVTDLQTAFTDTFKK